MEPKEPPLNPPLPSPAVTPRISPSLVHSTPSRTPGRTPASVGRVSGQAENEDADSATGTRTVDGKLQHLQETVDKLLEMHEMSAANSSGSSNTARHQKLPKELTADLHHVVKAFRERIDNPIEWDFSKPFSHADNLAATEEVVKAVTNENTTAALARRAASTYFLTLKRQNHQNQNPDGRRSTLAKQRKRQRKHNKLRRRLGALKASTTLSTTEKEKFKEILNIAFMSSEESGTDESDNDHIEEGERTHERVMIVRPLIWRSEEAQSILCSLDRKASRRRSQRASEMMVKRKVGAPSDRAEPGEIPD